MNRILDWSKYLEIAAKTVSEGIVMLKNRDRALPLRKDDVVSVFGRIQLDYYKSGTGSGGMVNVSKVTGIVDGLLEAGVKLNEELLGIYKKWTEENPFDLGGGWGGEPWSQAEMPLDDETVENAEKSSSCAVVIIGRTAGEENENREEPGSYLLTDTEKDMLKKVTSAFDRVIVLLNVGNLIDLSFIESCDPAAILYVWQGGMTGGTGTADVLTGRVSPSGKLPDTVAYSISDYPSSPYFGGKERNFYCEDIYVGYRWFETFACDRVRYPFGFGLSYTTFDVRILSAHEKSGTLTVRAIVENTGSMSGKEVVQLYCECPQGRLGKPLRTLCAYIKTKELAPGESQDTELTVKLSDLASYDDSGATGHRFCYVLEEGEYNFYAGTDVRSARPIYTVTVPETTIVRRCVQAMAPVLPFKRLRPVPAGNGYVPAEEDAPLNEVNEAARRIQKLPPDIPQTGDRGIKLADVLSGKNTMNDFIAQLSDYDLTCIVRGEGMGSPKVTPGTASAFGGVTDTLVSFGIPAGCCDDGPSGMRLDTGIKAFSLPNGTLIASTFNTELVTELYEYMGLEMTANKVECLLGPGMNIHRHPLNGRNFEYFSEDPYLTGTVAAAELKGLHNAGVTGTVKHFSSNNQETCRHTLDAAVSERALREIYLKGFEIAVREGGADSVMTTYGSVNGLWTAGYFDQNTVILRDEWGFDGFVMTDWWADINTRTTPPGRTDLAAMVRAQNDVYMVCADSAENDDDLEASLADGTLTRGELQRSAANICRFLMHSNAMKRLLGTADTVEIINRPDDGSTSNEPVEYHEVESSFTLDLTRVKTEKGGSFSFGLIISEQNWYRVTLTASSVQSELAQLPVTIYVTGIPFGTFTFSGTGGEKVSHSVDIPMYSRFCAVRLYFAQGGLDLESITFANTGRSADAAELS
ncbi:MAG: glycoside hydrolase family 3 protein [Ruminococcus sp.]|nr:glycoside hydrolase family 3 protein [Ruminococcus sp.]